MIVKHNFEPVYNKDSKVLILGTIPSPKSRELGFYYGHPQNRFWSVISAVLNTDVPLTIEAKKRLLTDNRIALWDVLKSCEITGASDSTIKNPVANDFSQLFNEAAISAVFTTGKTAWKLYNTYCGAFIKARYLPSTSPANRKVGINELITAYSEVLPFIKQTP